MSNLDAVLHAETAWHEVKAALEKVNSRLEHVSDRVGTLNESSQYPNEDERYRAKLDLLILRGEKIETKLADRRDTLKFLERGLWSLLVEQRGKAARGYRNHSVSRQRDLWRAPC